jgi:putative peptidoglycan lipid II flippase
LLISLPAAVMMGVIAHPLLATLFHGGAFEGHDVAMSAAALSTYGLGLTGFILVKVLVPGYYARQDTRTPVRIGLIAMGVNTGLNLLLLVPAVQRSLPAPHAFLALSTSLAAYLNALMLYRGLRTAGVYTPSPGWPRFLTRMGLANGAIGAGLWFWVPAAPYWVAIAGRERLLALGMVLMAVALAYAALLWILGLRPRHFRMPAEAAVTSAAEPL